MVYISGHLLGFLSTKEEGVSLLETSLKVNIIIITMALLVGYEAVEWVFRTIFEVYAFEISVIDTIFDLIFGTAGIWLFFILQKHGVDLTGIQCDTRERQAVEVRINE